MKQLRKGFTLIELLVVIAIIGILAAVVLVNVNGARVKAKEAALRAALASYRTAQEVQYDTAQTYVASTDSTVSSIVAQIRANSRVTTVAPLGSSNATSYALAAETPSSGAGTTASPWLYACVDSTGANKVLSVTTRPANTITVCP